MGDSTTADDLAPPPLNGKEIADAIRRRPTDRQQKILDFVATYTAASGCPPTMREIGAHMGIRSTNGVEDHLRALERKGFIRRRDGLSRSTTIVGAAPSSESFAHAVTCWRTENAALTQMLTKVLAASTRLPKLTAEFVVLLGDIRDITSGPKDNDHE